jgi:hypothetical protein
MAGSAWHKGCMKSFNGRLRDELPNTDLFDTLP